MNVGEAVVAEREECCASGSCEVCRPLLYADTSQWTVPAGRVCSKCGYYVRPSKPGNLCNHRAGCSARDSEVSP